MGKTILRKISAVSLSLALVFSYIPCLSAGQAPITAQGAIDMVSGDIQSVAVSGLTKVSVTNPEVADISDVTADKVSLIAKKGGETVLFLWDAAGKRSVRVRVAGEDLFSLKERVQKLLQEANINGVSMEENYDIGKVVLTGTLTKEDKNRMTDILVPYSDNLLELVKEEKSEDLIQVDMQIVEVQAALEKNLGILWGTNTTNNIINTSGNIAGTSSTNSGQVGLNYLENPPSGNKFKDMFKIGHFQRGSPLEFTLNALIQEGKARLISKPRLVVLSGKQASFLVGGELPVQSTTISTTGNTLTSNVSYAQYGVNLSVTPTVRKNKVDVLLNVDIRDIDASNSTNGNAAFITRSATTNLFMDNKQTVVLAGLIKYSDSKQVTGVPILSKIPLVGLLFRNVSYPTPWANTEMVIILTPTVLTDKKFADNQVAMPTPSERASWREIDSKYEHEPLPPSPAPSVTSVVSETRATTTMTVPSAASAPAVAASASAPDTVASAVLPAMTAYARAVQEKISKAIVYPQDMGNTLAGTVKLKLHILKNGQLDSAQVVQSSGNVHLDEDAMQAARQAAPYDAFTPGMDQNDVVFMIPIVYNKVIAGAQPPQKVVASY